MGHVSREMETLRNSQKEMLEIIKPTVTEKNSVFVALISRLDRAKKKISEFEQRSTELS